MHSPSERLPLEDVLKHAWIQQFNTPEELRLL